MSQSRRLPQWPPRASTATAPSPLSGRHQQLHRVRELPTGESVLGDPIFRGGWETFGGDHPKPGSLSSVESEHSSNSGGEQQRCLGKVFKGIQRCESGSRSTRKTNSQTRVRFDLGKTSTTATAASNHEEAIFGHAGATATSAACRRMSFLQEEEGERGEAQGAGDEDKRFFATTGQCFVVGQRNGMHTAWRLQQPTNCNNGNPAYTPTAVHDSITSPINAGGEYSVSADQLVSLTTSSSSPPLPQPLPQQQQQRRQQCYPVRVFLRRTGASQSAPTNSVWRGGARTADGTWALTGSEGRQVGVGFVDLPTFPLPWPGRPSPLHSNKEDGARTGAPERRGGPSTVLMKPRRSGGWGGTSRAASLEQEQKLHCRRTSVRGCPTLPRLASRSSPRNTVFNSGHDENSRPPSARAPGISSPAVRQNLARAARKSKVGTKADPVTLYRQRQELEQARIKNVAARNRKDASRERRSSGGFALGFDGAAAVCSVVGRRTRAAGSGVGRVGRSLR